MCQCDNGNPSKVDDIDKTKVSIATIIALDILLMTDLKCSAHKVQSYDCCNETYCRILAFM